MKLLIEDEKTPERRAKSAHIFSPQEHPETLFGLTEVSGWDPGAILFIGIIFGHFQVKIMPIHEKAPE